MHEYGMAEVIVHAIQHAVEGKKGAKPMRCYVQMGALCGINPEALEGVFEIAAKGTVAEKAELKVSIKPSTFRCRNCNAEIHIDGYIDMLVCEECGSPDVEFPGDAKHIYMTKLVVEEKGREKVLDLKSARVEEKGHHHH